MEIWKAMIGQQSFHGSNEKTQKHTSCLAKCWFWVTYHVGVEGRRELLGVQLFPVDGGEEHVVLDLSLEGEQKKRVKLTPMHSGVI